MKLIRSLVLELLPRKKKDIDRAKYDMNAITVFIKNDNVEAVTSNEADANVENYEYDYYIENNGTIKDFETNIKVFYFNIALKLLKKIDKREDI